jgi:hypothetical protein
LADRVAKLAGQSPAYSAAQTGDDEEASAADNESQLLEELIEAEEGEALPADAPTAETPAAVPTPGASGEGQQALFVLERGVDWAVWQGVVAGAGDWAMAARLEALSRAAAAGCDLEEPKVAGLPIAQMVLAEAAVAAFQGVSEEEWRDGWTRRLLKLAARWNDESSRDGVVEVLVRAGHVISALRAAGVWPWQPAAA